MKKFDVEIKTGNEITPDDNIWDGDCFQDAVEAKTKEEALELAIDSYIDWGGIDNAKECGYDWERTEDCIKWNDDEGVKNWVLFRAAEIEV